MRAHDWSKTTLGRAEGWPQSLKTAVSMMLNSRYPMFIGWGPDLVFLYNDAYRPILGATKHPRALGHPTGEVWAEIWDTLGPLAGRAVNDGEPTWSDDLVLMMNRFDYLEETYFTFSYSPVRDETGGVGGMFCACTETTGKVLGERRLRCLRDLAAAAAQAKTVDEAYAACLAVLATSRADTPFALAYGLPGEGRARLIATAGVETGAPAAPVAPSVGAGAWPFARPICGGQAQVVDDLPSRIATVPTSVWGDPVRTALILPVAERSQGEPAAVLVLGINSRRALDDDYRSFLDLVGGSIATAAANARAFEEERRRAEALAEIDRAKTLFFSNVSHEFRTPLTLMLGPIEEMLRRASLAAEDRRELSVAHRNALRLLKLVNSLLDFSRVEAGRAEAVFQPTDLAAFTADLASSFRSACERAGLELRIDCAPLPQPVYVDRDMWEKIVLNLLSNAFKFTFEGEIAVRLQAGSGQVALTVRDTGTGIPAAELPRVFERFHRIENARGRTHEGTGIGLALVQELVRLHGGTIEAASTFGVGTTFTVRLPLGTAHLPPGRISGERTLASSATRAHVYVEEALGWLPGRGEVATADVLPEVVTPATSVAPGRERLRLLVADDNADMLDYLRRLLCQAYAVEAVGDGEAALEAARALRPDLVLTDVMMPRRDGFGLLAALRADPALSDVPVIMLSARAGEEAQIEGLTAGADDYLVTPFSARELLARIQSNLTLAQVRRQAAEAVRASQQRLQQVLETDAVGVLFFSTEGTLLDANDSFLRMSGYSRADIQGGALTWRVLTPPEWFEVSQQQMAACAMTGRIGPYEKEYFRKDGTRSWLMFAGRDLGDGTIVEFAIDIGDRKRAEQRVRESEERLRLLSDNLPGSMVYQYAHEPDGRSRFLYVSGGVEELNQVTASAALEDAEVLHRQILPEYRAWLVDAELRSARELSDFEMELPMRRPDGQVRWMRLRSRPRREPGGRVVWDGVQTDITLRKQAEAALQESREHFRMIFEHAATGIAIADWSGRFVQCNAAFCAIVDFGEDALRGLTYRELIHPDDLEANLAQVRRLIDGEMQAFQIENRYVRRDGKPAWVHKFVSALPDSTGRPAFLLALVTDVTDRKRAEQHRELLVNELNHRVNNTLATIQSIAAQTLRTGCEPTVRQAFEDRLLSLAKVHDLLTRENWDGASLEDTALQALRPHRDEGRQEQITVTGPECRLTPKIALALSMAIHELATNAAKHGALSTPAGRVALSWSIADDRLRLSWRESGGPPVEPPARRGFGSRLIERGLAHELKGEVRIAYDPAGVVCEIVVPIIAQGRGRPNAGL